jgi:hypothetical protein
MWTIILSIVFIILLGLLYYISNLIAVQHILMGSRHMAPFLANRVLGFYPGKRREHYTHHKTNST